MEAGKFVRIFGPLRQEKKKAGKFVNLRLRKAMKAMKAMKATVKKKKKKDAI